MAFTTDDLPRKISGERFPRGRRAYYDHSDTISTRREITDDLLHYSDTASLQPAQKQLLIKELNELAALPTGAKLMKNVSSYLSQNNRKLRINFTTDPEKNTSFEPSEKLKTPAVHINLNELKKDEHGYYSALPEIKSRAVINGKDVFEIALGRTPLFMTLGHELMHFAKNIDKQQRGKERKIRFPEDMQGAERSRYPIFNTPRISSTPLMYQTDEYENVVGKSWTPKNLQKTRDNFSELTLRMEAGLNPRYIYQGQQPGSRFFELADTVRRVIGDDNFRQLRGRLPQYSGSFRPTIPAAEQDFFEYTPFSVLRELYPLHKAQQRYLISGTGSDTIKDRQRRLAPERLHRILQNQIESKYNVATQSYNEINDIMRQHPVIANNAFNDTLGALKRAAQKLARTNNTNEDAIYRYMVNEYNNRGRRILDFQPFTENSSAPPSFTSGSPPPPPSAPIDNNLKAQLRAKLNRMLFKRFIQYS